MRQQPRYVDKNSPHHVCRLDKAIYGLKQAPRAWYSRLSDELQQLDFVPSKCDMSLFFLNNRDVTIFVLVYIDDIIVASFSKCNDNITQKSREGFCSERSWIFTLFFGIEATKLNNVILLS
jgi:hypothetical protein